MGNLCNNQIEKLMQQVFCNFGFERAAEAERKLLQ
jgi:hypothetical protein